MGAFRRHLLLATMAGLVMVAGAAAQDLERGTTQPERGLRIDKSGQPYRPWDLTIGTGFQFDDDTQAWVPRDFSYDGWDGAWGLQADVGHYWTSHLKTEASAALLTNREQYGYENLTIQGRPAQAPWFSASGSCTMKSRRNCSQKCIQSGTGRRRAAAAFMHGVVLALQAEKGASPTTPPFASAHSDRVKAAVYLSAFSAVISRQAAMTVTLGSAKPVTIRIMVESSGAA